MSEQTEESPEKVFGYEWAIYRELIPLHKKQFEGWISPLDLSFFKGKRFLDAGCGIGRNSFWALEAGAASGCAFDYDPRTLESAKANLKDFKNCEVLYHSIYDLSFRDEFDVVFCIGVIQHLLDPKKAVENLVRSLKPGGTLILWVYAYEGNERYLAWFDPLRRYVSSKIHPRLALWMASLMTALLKLYLVFPHRDPYLKLLKERSFRHMEAMVFDQLIPNISNYFRKEELLELIRGLPVKTTHLTHTHDMSWTLVAVKES